MLRYIIKRILSIFPALLVASIVIFGLVHLAPGDPVTIMLGGKQASQETREALTEKYHLDENVVVQYGYWLKGALHGDFGESYKSKQSVSSMIAARLGITIQLVLMSLFISVGAGTALGMISGIKKNTILDRVSSTLSFIGSSSPIFFTAIIFVIIFSYKLNWLPAFGTGSSVLENFQYLLLPSLALGINMVTLNSRLIRSSMINVLDSNFIQTVRAKGMPSSNIYFKHALRNSLIPMVTVAGLQVGFLITGAVLVENTFGIGGIGSLIVQAVLTNDYPLIQGAALLIVSVYLVVNMVVDILYAVIDPRVSYSS